MADSTRRRRRVAQVAPTASGKTQARSSGAAPWLVVALVLVGVALAVLWLRAEALRDQRKRELGSVAMATEYNPEVCGMATPLAVSARNDGKRIVKAIQYHVRGFKAGDSAAHDPTTFEPFTRVLRPGQSETVCINPQFRWPLGKKEHALWSSLTYRTEIMDVKFFEEGEFIP